MNVNELDLTKLLVYGTSTLDEDPNKHIRTADVEAPSITLSSPNFQYH